MASRSSTEHLGIWYDIVRPIETSCILPLGMGSFIDEVITKMLPACGRHVEMR